MAMPPIIDPHVHLWAPRSTPRAASPLATLYAWSRRVARGAASVLFPKAALDFVGKVDHVAADYLPPHYRQDVADLDIRGVVHVEASWQARDALAVAAETRWLEGLEDHGLLLGIVGAADLAYPHLDALLDAHLAASPRFRGVRHKLSCSPHRGIHDWTPDPELLSNPAWHRGYARLGERDLTFDAWMYSHQLAAFRKVAAAYPDTRVILDHVGTPIGLGGPFGGLPDRERADIEARWRDDLAALAELPHVHLKLSGLLMPILGFGLHTREPIDADALAELLGPHVRFALGLFGPDRCSFASNFPMDKVSTSLATLYGAFDRITADRTEAERKALFAGNAQRFYRLETKENLT